MSGDVLEEAERDRDTWERIADERTAEVVALRAEVARLRGLIKQVEQTDNDFGTLFCPWCCSAPNGVDNHRDDCAAFTPSGEVR